MPPQSTDKPADLSSLASLGMQDHVAQQQWAPNQPAAKGKETAPAESHTLLKTAGVTAVSAALIFGGLRFRPLTRLLGEAAEEKGALTKATELFGNHPLQSAETLISGITAKINQGCLTPEKFSQLLTAVKPEDRDIASSFMRLSLGNASDYTLMHNLADMGTQLKASGVKLTDLDQLNSAYPGSPGQITGYLFRKANGLKLGIHNLGAFEAPSYGSPNNPIVLFDHIKDLDAKQTEQLQTAIKGGRRVFVMDVNNFHGGINFVDMAKGEAEQKLVALVEEAKRVRQAAAEAPGAVSQTMTPDQLAHHVLNAKTDADAAAIGATVIRPAANTEQQLFGQLANRDKVEAFFARYQNPTHKRVALETVANAGYDSFTGIAEQTRKLHGVITSDAVGSGLDPVKDVRYLVGIDNFPNLGASSGGFVSSIYRQVNELPRDRFVDLTRMYFHPTPEVAAKRTYVLDDMSHSGEQIVEVFRDLHKEGRVGSLSFATLHALDTSSAFKYAPTPAREAAGRLIRFMTLSKEAPVEGATKRTVKALAANKSWFSRPSPELVQARAYYQAFQEMTAKAPQKNMRLANQLTPYVLSDRTNPVTEALAKEVLKLHQWGLSQPE